ncbi:MAG: hypothetical protein AAF704_11665, partial [Cyanobacteria bacterium P01_D01_bin.123]
ELGREGVIQRESKGGDKGEEDRERREREREREREKGTGEREREGSPVCIERFISSKRSQWNY